MKALSFVVITMLFAPFVQGQDPIAHFIFSGNPNDITGNGNNGTAIGAVLTSDRFGHENSAYFFDGIDDLIDVGDKLNFRRQDFTISFWFKRSANDPSGSAAILSKGGYQSSVAGYAFLGNESRVNYSKSDGEGISSIGAIYEVGFWTKITLARCKNNTAFVMYTNDVRTASGNSSVSEGSTSSSSKFIIGGTDVDKLAWKGEIDDVRIYDRALSEQEIVDLYNSELNAGNRAPYVENTEFVIDENTEANTLIGSIDASDPEGSNLNFSIIAGNDSEAFRIDETTGELFVKIAESLDFETTPEFELSVEVSDGESTNIAIISLVLNDLEDSSILSLENDPLLTTLIYPNPFSTNLTIKNTDFDKGYIYTMTGKLIYEFTEAQVNMTHLPAGMSTSKFQE